MIDLKINNMGEEIILVKNLHPGAKVMYGVDNKIYSFERMLTKTEALIQDEDTKASYKVSAKELKSV